MLGPNGAGKTTVVKMPATLLRPDGGEARVFGKDVTRDPDAVRSRVSLTGQYASVDEDLTGTENLVLLARLLGHSRPASRDRAAQLLEAFGLSAAVPGPYLCPTRTRGRGAAGPRGCRAAGPGLTVAPVPVPVVEPHVTTLRCRGQGNRCSSTSGAARSYAAESAVAFCCGSLSDSTASAGVFGGAADSGLRTGGANLVTSARSMAFNAV